MKTLTTSEAKAWALKRYCAKCEAWLAGELDAFPLSIPLLELTEKDFMANQPLVRQVYAEWRDWSGPGTLEHTTYRWARAGEHTLPTRLHLASPPDVALLADKLETWACARNRMHALNALTALPPERFSSLYSMLASLAEPDWRRLRACVRYFVRYPNCGLYIRQLPIEGVDTKWVGTHIHELTQVLRVTRSLDGDFYALTGVRRPDHLNHVVVRVLCPELRKQVAGLHHLDVPVSTVATWTLRPDKVLFVENLESGIALEDLPGTIAFVGKGNAATALAQIDWVAQTKAYYWGDIDTYGLAIFGRMQALLPSLTPILMDAATFAAHKGLWVSEAKQHPPLDNLPAEQQLVFKLLTEMPATKNMRLEQERIPWGQAWLTIQAELA